MRPGEYSKRERAKAVALVRDRGFSYAAAGKEIGGATRDSVKRWCDAAGVRSGAADARTDVPRPGRRNGAAPINTPVAIDIVADPPTEIVEQDDSLEASLRELTTQARWMQEQAKLAAADGNMAAASKWTRDAAKMLDTAARLKADLAKRAGGGGVVFSAERLKQARAQLIEMADRLAASPEGSMGVCPRCGADIRAARASAPDAAKEQV